MNFNNQTKAREILARSPWCNQQDAIKAWDEAVAQLIAPPEPWTGEGLPPVGTVCEARIYDGTGNLAWFECRVIHHHPRHKGSAAIAHGNEELLGWSSDFRPIRTPDQIAAEEREVGITQMRELVGSLNTHPFAELWDAGYRKQVEP